MIFNVKELHYNIELSDSVCPFCKSDLIDEDHSYVCCMEATVRYVCRECQRKYEVGYTMVNPKLILDKSDV